MIKKIFLIIKKFILFQIRKLLIKNNHDIFNYSKVISVDDIYSNLNLDNPIIFDVGAHEGESILRFQKIFDKSLIYSFEPQKLQYEKIKEYNFSNSKTSNLALSNKNGSTEFFITKKTSNSSLIEINPNSKKAKNASIRRRINPNDFIQEKISIKTLTGDSFCEKNNIQKIDILKIDTQGHNSQVVEGFKRMIDTKKIDIIETEIVLGNFYKNYEKIYDFEKILLPNFRLVGIFNSLGKVVRYKDDSAHQYLNHNIFFEDQFIMELLYIRADLKEIFSKKIDRSIFNKF